MIRALSFVVWAIVIAAAIVLAFVVDGAVSAQAFGWRMDIPAGIAVAAAIFTAAILIFATSALKDIAGAPRFRRARRAVAKYEKGVAALMRGAEAVDAGDAAAARKQAQLAKKALGDAPAAKLLAAEAAELSGDDSALISLKDEPDAEFLALKRLHRRAMRQGDFDSAQAAIDRALALHPKTGWALRARSDLALERLDFDAAQGAVLAAARAGAESEAAALRAAAVAATASAYLALRTNERGKALAAAESALKHAPDFPPAVLLTARLYADSGELRKSEKLLGDAFAAAPEESLAAEARRLFLGGATLPDKLVHLADLGGDSRASQMLRADAHLHRGEAVEATELLSDLLKSSATALPLRLMAKAQALLNSRDDAEPWLKRAAAAPRETDADYWFRMTPDGWRTVLRNYRDDGRFLPALDEPSGLTDEDFLLLAPPEVYVSPPAPALEEAPPAEELLDRGAAAARGVS